MPLSVDDHHRFTPFRSGDTITPSPLSLRRDHHVHGADRSSVIEPTVLTHPLTSLESSPRGIKRSRSEDPYGDQSSVGVAGDEHGNVTRLPIPSNGFAFVAPPPPPFFFFSS